MHTKKRDHCLQFERKSGDFHERQAPFGHLNDTYLIVIRLKSKKSQIKSTVFFSEIKAEAEIK